MGTDYVFQKPYDMAKTYEETSPATPMFFVLFPGVDPTPWVESLARTLDITTENGERAFREGARVQFMSALTFRIANSNSLEVHGYTPRFGIGCTHGFSIFKAIVVLSEHYLNTLESRLGANSLTVPFFVTCHVFLTGKFINISMGQGQEKPAEGVVERRVYVMYTW